MKAAVGIYESTTLQPGSSPRRTHFTCGGATETSRSPKQIELGRDLGRGEGVYGVI